MNLLSRYLDFFAIYGLTQKPHCIAVRAVKSRIFHLFIAASVAGASFASDSLSQAIQSSIKDVRVLSPEWVCLVVDPTEEIFAVRTEKFGDALQKDRNDFDEGRSSWFFEKSKTYRTLQVQNSYHLPLFAKMNKAGFWKINDATPADVTVWSHSVDAMPGWSASDAPALDSGPYCRTADMVYLKLPAPLTNGESLRITGADGRAATMKFQEDSTVCWSIKVNQVAYSRLATKKAAFLGLWLPGIGPLDFHAWEGKPFYVKKFEPGKRWCDGQAVGDPVFTGSIHLRKPFSEQQVVREGGSNLTGEDVYELDFSEFQDEGRFCIQIPGMGRSWPFSVTSAGSGEAFYTVMKGLFIQRCGMELKKPFTAWERPACHTETRQGQFVPETGDWYLNRYRQKSENEATVGFRTENSTRTGVTAFTLIGNSAPDSPVLPHVHGGWHDAADFDRRYGHYNVMWDLLALAEAFPQRFRDGQLNIPESGNGVPDILDEVAWGLDLWRSTQTPEGGVSSWIEMESHPGTRPGLVKSFVENQMPFYASIPDRTGSFAYAAAAAWLSRLIAPSNPQRAKEYLESAKKAFTWAMDDTHTMRDKSFSIEKPMRDQALKGTTIKFDEDSDITTVDNAFTDRSFAAANLFLATHDDAYMDVWRRYELGKKYAPLSYRINASRAVPILLNPEWPEEDRALIKKSILETADSLLASQNAHPYRMLWLAPTEGWFHTLAWGNFHQKVRPVAVSYMVTFDPRYLASLQNTADFFLGCNPLGSSMITGLGSVSPVVFQHIHSQSDGVAEPTPGIPPYSLTFGVPLVPFLIADDGHPSVKSFFEPVAMAFLPDKLGREKIQSEMDHDEKSGNWTREILKKGRSVLWDQWPVLRRKVTHPAAVVDQNEFTINETISPMAMLLGTLTADDWMPDSRLIRREPKTSIDDLPFYPMP